MVRKFRLDLKEVFENGDQQLADVISFHISENGSIYWTAVGNKKYVEIDDINHIGEMALEMINDNKGWLMKHIKNSKSF